MGSACIASPTLSRQLVKHSLGLTQVMPSLSARQPSQSYMCFSMQADTIQTVIAVPTSPDKSPEKCMTIQRGEDEKVLPAPTNETDSCDISNYYIHCGAPRFSNTRIAPLYPAARMTCTPHGTTHLNPLQPATKKTRASQAHLQEKWQQYMSQMHADHLASFEAATIEAQQCNHLNIVQPKGACHVMHAKAKLPCQHE